MPHSIARQPVTLGERILTNYPSQAGIIVALCLAFGWFDHFTPTRSVALAL
jgi:hypothetical protein